MVSTTPIRGDVFRVSTCFEFSFIPISDLNVINSVIPYSGLKSTPNLSSNRSKHYWRFITKIDHRYLNITKDFTQSTHKPAFTTFKIFHIFNKGFCQIYKCIIAWLICNCTYNMKDCEWWICELQIFVMHINTKRKDFSQGSRLSIHPT